MVVYADILICVNLIVNYALLMAAGRFCGRAPKRLRMVLAALLGALYALISFAGGLPDWVPAATKLPVGALLVLIAYQYRGLAEYVRQYVMFLLVSALFGGLMLALWLFVAPYGMLYENGVVYFDISALSLVGFTGAAYAATELFTRLFRKRDVESGMMEVSLVLGNRQVALCGFVDTGNTLRDAYTGYPVAICGMECVRSILPLSLLDIISAIIETEDFSRFQNLITPDTKNKFKLIPYSTVGFTGVLPAFLPDELRLDGVPVENVYVAIAPENFTHSDYDMLLSREMVPHVEKAEHSAKNTRGRGAKKQVRGRHEVTAGE